MQRITNITRLLARIAALLACASLLTVAADGARAATKRALLVGIGDYPCVTAENQKLRGAANDLDAVRFMLKSYGFAPADIVELRGNGATRAAILKALDHLAAQAADGDEVVFYFTGRGSVATDPKATDTNRAPTLATWDSRLDSDAGDVPLDHVAAWAGKLYAKGATATLVVDACFYSPTARGEDRHYNPVPRCLARHRLPRPAVYRGRGVFLCATDARGRAYEWRDDFAADRWMGAFTDELTNDAIHRRKLGQSPTYPDLMLELRRWFAAHKTQRYMAAEMPWPAAAEMSADYRQRAFAAVAPGPLSAADQQAVAAHDAATQKRRETLRVALDTPPAFPDGAQPDAAALEKANAARKALLAEVGGPFAEQTGRLEGVTVIGEGVRDPDRVVYVSRTADGLRATVEGDEVDRARDNVFEGRDASALMADGLAAYLQRQAYVLRLFNLTQDADQGTLRGVTWKAGTDQPRYKKYNAARDEGTPFAYVAETSAPGLVYFLDQDGDGIVQLTWPIRQAPDNALEPGRRVLSFKDLFVGSQTPAGSTLTRAVLVVPESGAALPSLAPPPGGWKDDRAYGVAEREHLRALLAAIASGKAKWASQTFSYEVLDNP